MSSKYIRYYYFDWKDGRPDEEKLTHYGEDVFETPNSKDGIYNGWAFMISNAKLTEKDIDILENFDLDQGCTYQLHIQNLKALSVHGNAQNIDKILTKKKQDITYIYKIRVMDDSPRKKLRGKFRAEHTSHTSVGRIYKKVHYLNASLRNWPLADDEEIVVYEMREKETLSGNDVKYGIRNANKKN